MAASPVVARGTNPVLNAPWAVHETLIEPLDVRDVDLTNEGETVGQIRQPKVPQNRADKERAKAAMGLAHLNDPTPPQKGKLTRPTTSAPITHVLTQSRMAIAGQRSPNR